MVGKPEYNKKKNSIDIKNLKFTLETKSFLLKSAAWLLRSTIKKKIQENMDFLLDYNMVEIQKQMQEQLQHYEVSKDIFLNGVLEGLNIQNAYLTPESIRVDIIHKRKNGPGGKWVELGSDLNHIQQAFPALVIHF